MIFFHTSYSPYNEQNDIGLAMLALTIAIERTMNEYDFFSSEFVEILS